MIIFFYALFSLPFAIILQLDDVFIAIEIDKASSNKTGINAIEVLR
jgi:hypothetical protein